MKRPLNQQQLDFQLSDNERERRTRIKAIQEHWFKMIEAIEHVPCKLTQGRKLRVVDFLKRLLKERKLDIYGVGTLRQSWVAKEWRRTEKTLNNWMKWAQSVDAIMWSIDTDADGVRRTTIEFTPQKLGDRVGMLPLPKCPHQTETNSDQTETVVDQTVTVSDQTEMVTGHSPSSENSATSRAASTEWKAAEEKLKLAELSTVRDFLDDASRLGKSPAEIIAAVETFNANRRLLESPGALRFWLDNNGKWPVEGIRTPAEMEAACKRRSEIDAKQTIELERSRRFKQLQRAGLSLETIESKLRGEGYVE